MRRAEVNIEREIRSRLSQIEVEEDVAICLAVESGSRAWGFPSADSDYDVRFIYVRRPEWYLTIDLENKSDVIEIPIDDRLDIQGWDVRKALKLFRKSNPPLLEWLQCFIIYVETSSLAARLRKLLLEFYSPMASIFHYLHMACGNHRSYLRGAQVWQKKYFYVLRPLLAILWIEQGMGPVPIEFDRLLEETISDVELKHEIENLLQAKKAGNELDRGPRIEAISRFIENELQRHENDKHIKSKASPPIEHLNAIFRQTLEEVWSNSD
ncbi:MAG: DNA polymerase beta superfamily protein [bacterium]